MDPSEIDSNHRLPVVTGKWDDAPLNEHKCNIGTTKDMCEESHYLFTCDGFKCDRKLYLKPSFMLSQIMQV